MNSIGSALTYMRQRADLTVEETASRAHVAPTYLTDVEAGRTRANPAWIGHVANILVGAFMEKLAKEKR